MNSGELIRLFRLQTDDVTAPLKWVDEELLIYLNEAEKEAARRGRLLIDSSTSAICTIAVTADNPTYDLDPRVIAIRRAKLASRSKPLAQASHRDLDATGMDWEASTGTVEAYMTDLETGKIRLYRTPTDTDTLTLTVERDPLAAMNDDEDEPEINARWHEKLVFWMKFRAYAKDDDEVKDPAKSQAGYVLFEAEFGPARSAVDEEDQLRHQQSLEDGWR